jgi:aminoglycoside phosphotransferase (APT) family kinase protein
MIRPRTTPDQLQHLFASGDSVAEEVLRMYFGGSCFAVLKKIKRPQAVVYIIKNQSGKAVLRLSRSPIYNVTNIANSYRKYSQLGVPVPTPKVSGVLNDIQYILMSYVTGEPFTFDIAEAAQQNAAADAGRYLTRLRQLPCEGFGYLDVAGVGILSDWSEFLQTHYPLTWIRQKGYITQAESDLLHALKRHAEYPEAQSRLLHGDYKFKNLFTNSDGTISAITDPQPLAGDPLWDFATFNHFSYREQARQGRPYGDSFFVSTRNRFKEAYEAELGRKLYMGEVRSVTCYEIITGFGKVEDLLKGRLDEVEGESRRMLEYLRQRLREV